MKHWVPDESAVEPRPARARRQRLSAGSKAGLALVALACAGMMFGAYQTLGRADVFADEPAGAVNE